MGVTTRSKAVTDAIFERVPIIIYQMMSDNPQRQKELCHDDKYVKRNLKVNKLTYESTIKGYTNKRTSN